MMLPTHAMVGLAIATPLLTVTPELAPAGLVGGVVGGVVPDLDLYADHRRTLHFPTGYTLAALLAVGLALLTPQPLTVGLALFFLGAAAHCRMDRYGGGLELRPWEGDSDRGVYDHVQGQWRSPKRWIPYDGSPQDLVVLCGLSVPLFVALDGPFRTLVGIALGVGVVYTALRRRLAAIAPVVFGLVPEAFQEHVPERYRH